MVQVSGSERALSFVYGVRMRGKGEQPRGVASPVSAVPSAGLPIRSSAWNCDCLLYQPSVPSDSIDS